MTMKVYGSVNMGLAVEMVVVVVIVLGASLRQDLVSGQQLPCSTSTRNPQNCCPCNESAARLCENGCPSGYWPKYENVSAGDYCTIRPSPTGTTTSFPSSRLGICLPCHVTCKTCSGPQPEDCQECAADHEFKTVNGWKRCEKKEEANVGVIIGAVIGSVVAVVVVVLLVVFLCRRYRKENDTDPLNKRSTRSMMGSGSALPVRIARDTESGVKVEKKKASKVQTLKDATYTNMDTTVPNTESIEQGHDKVLRYTHDPTVKVKKCKGQSSKPKSSHLSSPAEDEELANLPEAPVPPGQKPATYEIVENPFSAQPQPTPKPKSTVPVMEAPTQSYEIMDFPTSPEPQTARSRITVLKTGPGNKHGQKRRTAREPPPKSQSLPHPAAPISCPEMPRFPTEKYQKRQAASHYQSHQHVNRSPASPTHLKEEAEEDPDEDYINVDPKTEAISKVEQEASDPEEDYENTGPKKKLVDPENPQGEAVGFVNPAAELLEEPQEVYENREMVDEQETETRHSNTPLSPATQENMDVKSSAQNNNNSVDENSQPMDTNDETDDEDAHDYENCPRPRSKP